MNINKEILVIIIFSKKNDNILIVVINQQKKQSRDKSIIQNFSACESKITK